MTHRQVSVSQTLLTTASEMLGTSDANCRPK